VVARAVELLGRRGEELVKSVVESCLQKVNCFVGDPIHETVFLSDPSGPAAIEYMFQGFWFADTSKWVPHDRVDEIENTQGSRAVVFNPETKILKKLWLENSEPLSRSLHAGFLFAIVSRPGA
jgi:hypothetical protein